MLRNIAAIIFSFILGFMLTGVTFRLTQKMHPIPENFNLNDTEAVIRYAESTPSSVYSVVIIGHILGVFLAVFLAAKLASSHKFVLSLFPGLILFIATISFTMMMPYPRWILVVEIIGIFTAALLAARLGSGGVPDYDF